ncbi:LON peptidase substrate-binding domain-containing protein [soil metagenome]
MPSGFVRASDLPAVLPVFPLDGAILLPRGQIPLNIFEPRYLNMIDDVMAGDRLIGMVQTKTGMSGERPSLQGVGCVGRVTSFTETSDGRYLITLSGLCRFAVGDELSAPTPYRQVRARFAPFERDLDPPADDEAVDREPLMRALKAYLERKSMAVDWDAAEQAPVEALTNSLAMALPFEALEKQVLLEAATLEERLDTLAALLAIEAAGSEDDEPPLMQ